MKLELKDLVIGKEYGFGGDGVVVLTQISIDSIYLKGEKMRSYPIVQKNGSVGFTHSILNCLTEIKK